MLQVYLKRLLALELKGGSVNLLNQMKGRDFHFSRYDQATLNTWSVFKTDNTLCCRSLHTDIPFLKV